MKVKSSNPALSTERQKRALTIVFLIAFGLRALLIVYLHAYAVSEESNHWAFGYEEGRIAASIADGQGFSSPFHRASGPTSWLAPIYPYFLALTFKIFGIYSTNAALFILLFQSLISSLTGLALYFISKKTFSDHHTALLTAILFAFYPPSIWHAINTIWDTTLFAFSISLLFAGLIKCSFRLTAVNTLLVGLLMGAIPLINPAILAFYPLALVWLFRRSRSDIKEVSRHVIAIAAITLLLIFPWIIRNYLVFGQFVFIKSGLGVELRIGNNPEATGSFPEGQRGLLHPTISEDEFALYNEMGEIEYVKYCYHHAMLFIKEHPGRFLRLSLKRVYYFWIGDLFGENRWSGNLSRIGSWNAIKKVCYILPFPFFIGGIFLAWKKRVDISLFLFFFITFPLVYYVTHVTNRYRYPLEPFLLVISAYGFHHVLRFAAQATKAIRLNVQMNGTIYNK